MKRLSLIGFILALSLVFTAQAAPLPLVVEEVQIDDTLLTENAVNRLDLERGNVYEVEVLLTALADVDDVELSVFVSGFEFNDIQPLRATTHVFDLDSGVTKKFRLQLHVSDEVEEDDYKLRLMLNDRFSDPIFVNYNLKLDVPRHGLQIEDVVLNPFGDVKAGHPLLATVRVENKGEKDEDDVKVVVSIPELGVAGVDYIDLIEFDEEEQTEEIYIRIPETAKSGTYTAQVDVYFEEGFNKVTQRIPINVIGDPRFTTEGKPVEPVEIVVGSQLETATQGQGVLYPITIKNNGHTKRTFSLSANTDFADITINPSSTLIISGGDEQLFSVWLTPKEQAEPGVYNFNVVIKEGKKTIKELPFTTQVIAAEHSNYGVVLTVLAIIIILAGIIVGVLYGMRKNEEKLESPETYY